MTLSLPVGTQYPLVGFVFKRDLLCPKIQGKTVMEGQWSRVVTLLLLAYTSTTGLPVSSDTCLRLSMVLVISHP